MMLIKWFWSAFSVPDALVLTGAWLLCLTAISTTAWWFIAQNELRIKLWLIRSTARMEAFSKRLQENDEPVMPRELIDWASGDLWRDRT